MWKLSWYVDEQMDINTYHAAQNSTPDGSKAYIKLDSTEPDRRESGKQPWINWPRRQVSEESIMKPRESELLLHGKGHRADKVAAAEWRKSFI